MQSAALQIVDFEDTASERACRTKARLDLVDTVTAPPAREPAYTGPRMIALNRDAFLALRRALPAATKDCLRETFGISETTWVKLRDGRPVKEVTLERLMARYRRVVGGQAVTF